MRREAQIFKALSEEVRLRLMILLTHGELRVQDMVEITGLPQSTVSRHLAYLRNERLATMRSENVQSLYGLNRQDDALVRTLHTCLGSCFADDEIARRDKEALKALRGRQAAFESRARATSILFVCVHNSARSQMAEAFANHLSGGGIRVLSAGFEPGGLNPFVLEVMKEKGINMAGSRSKSIDDVFDSRTRFEYVITVCAESEGQRCPSFPGETTRLHWEFEDPSNLEGPYREKLQMCRDIRDKIEKHVGEFLESIQVSSPGGATS
jgi:arsenate reductase